MAKIIYLRCRHCGEELRDRGHEYCPPCNLSMAYRAMPLILGLLLLPRLAAAPAHVPRQPASPWPGEPRSYDDDSALNWE